MHIAVDTRDLRIARTGNRTYLEELCRVFPTVTDAHQFHFIAPNWQIPSGKSPLHKIIAHLAFYWWKEIELPWHAWRKKCDVIFCTDYVVPLWASAATVPVFHDAGFWERPQDYNRLWRKLLNLLALPAARHAAAVITVSQSARERIASLTGIPLTKLHVVYEAPKHAATTSQPEDWQAILARYQLQNKPFMLHVGVMEKRKNLTRLVEAFAQAQPHLLPDYRLVLVGQPGPKIDMDDSTNIHNVIQRHGLAEKVILTGYVDDAALSTFYHQAAFYIFPSLYEGFGLPILEAFANNLPVAAARATSLPEIAGDAAVYFDPLNCTEMAAQIKQLAVESDLRRSLAEKGRQRLKVFTWEKTAQEIINVFEDVTT